MVADPPRPFDGRQGPVWIALLLLAVVSLALWRIGPTREAPSPAAERISAKGRILELQQSILSLATPRIRGLISTQPAAHPAPQNLTPWDSALMAILAAERGDRGAAAAWLESAPVNPEGTALRRCFAAAYQGSSEKPTPQERTTVQQALRAGYAAHLLEAGLEAGTPKAQRLRDEARAWALPRVTVLAVAGLALLVLVPGGLVLGVVLAVSPEAWKRAPLPEIRLSGQDIALVLLGWMLAFLLSGMLIGPLLARIPFLHPFIVPMTYGFHALIGLALLARLEGLTPREMWRRWTPGPTGRNLAWGLGFLALAGTLVLTVTLLLGPLLERQEAPQQQLMDLVAETRGALPVLSLFFTVALAAPVFEECLFRGTLLPWLGARWRGPLGPRLGWAFALAASSLAFGLIHLQPVALPVLSTLGLTLGLAFLRTGNLLTAILVHGLWNGGVFLFYRVVLG